MTIIIITAAASAATPGIDHNLGRRLVVYPTNEVNLATQYFGLRRNARDDLRGRRIEEQYLHAVTSTIAGRETVDVGPDRRDAVELLVRHFCVVGGAGGGDPSSRTKHITMHTVWVRLNAVVFFGLTILLGLSILAGLSKIGHSDRPSGRPAITKLGLNNIKSLKNHGGVDRALLSFDLHVSLSFLVYILRNGIFIYYVFAFLLYLYIYIY